MKLTFLLFSKTMIYRVILLTVPPLNLAMFKSLYKIPYSNFFYPILLLGLGLSQIQGGTVKRITLYNMIFSSPPLTSTLSFSHQPLLLSPAPSRSAVAGAAGTVRQCATAATGQLDIS